MTAIIITADPFGGARVRFNYDPSLVELIKLLVPGHSRTWEPTTKTWALNNRIDAETFARHARWQGHTVQSDIGSQHHAPPKRPSTTTIVMPWADALLDAVGPARYDAVFRALTKVLHPDLATGDKVLMQDLNAARDRRAA